MPHILAVGTAVPEHIFHQYEVKEAVRKKFAKRFHGTERMLSIFENSNIEKRHFIVPMEWFEQEHSFAEKNALYIKYSTLLSTQAIIRCLEKTGFTIGEIDKIIFISSTGIATPSIDALLINKLHFHKNIKRTPIWGLGCAGGVVGLSRAFEYTKAFPDSKVLVVAVELCGITFQDSDVKKSNFIATALFGDGAAAALIVGDDVKTKINKVTPNIFNTRSTFWEDTLDMMGWRIGNNGMEVIFSKDIPSFVKKHIRNNIEEYLAIHNLDLADIKSYVVHPGGIKVIKAYQEALSLSDDAVEHAANVIKDFGNMSSPTVLFVLERVLNNPARAGEYGLITALGPGFSSETILFRWK